MANSQNGWPIAAAGDMDRAPLIRNVTVPNGVLRGDVAVVFRWLAEQYDRRVERLIAGWCWGWHVKPIEGSGVQSNHGSGTAVDFNAPDNPMGPGTTRRSMTAAQIAECHRLEEESGGVLRWGGDFTRNDPMHWEIIGTRAAVAAFARRIEGELPVDQTEFNKLMTGWATSTGGRAALHQAMKTIMEEDPATGEENYRWGGAIRMMNTNREKQTATIVTAVDAAADRVIAAVGTPPVAPAG